MLISHILVPTDGSDTARKAAAYGLELAALTHATVTLLTVIDRSVFVGRPSVPASETPTEIVEPLEDFLKQAAQSDMDEIETLNEQYQVPLRQIIRYGHPVEQIISEAETCGADMIVMGSHGRSALEAALLGSVTFGVVHKDTTIPILIVRK
jgi:nucleotide-binding universal stress UspA family protein